MSKRLLLLLLVFVLLISACAPAKPKVEPEKLPEQKPQLPKEEKPIVQKTPEEKYAQLEKDESYSPLNGKKVKSEALKRRPLCVMFDNHIDARPQSSLDMADIVYEILVEGQITRYMGVFQSQTPALIGPVRSARPYFLRLALEHDGYYAHVGGSEAAKSDIKKLKLADLDGMASAADTYWREKHRKAPHNMYASYKSLMDWAKYMEYKKEYEAKALKFAYKSGDSNAQSKAFEFKIIFKDPGNSDKIGYFVGFKYDEKADEYLRFVNGEAHRDETSKEHLKAGSIIVQRVDTRTLDNEGRLAVDLVGKGEGYYFHNGVMEPITWKKADDRSKTRYYTKSGEELVLFPGVLWIEIVPKALNLSTPEGEIVRIAR